MRGTDAGYSSPGYRGRGNYSYENVSESRRRSEYRASGSYEYGSPRQNPPRGGSGRGVDVRVLDDDAPPPPPQRIYVRERQQPDIEIYHQRAPQPRIRYQDEGGDDQGGGDQYFEPRGRGPAPRGGDYGDEQDYRSAPQREERLPYKPQRQPTDRERVIEAANEHGPDFYEVDGKWYEAVAVDGRWKVYRTDEPMDYRPATRAGRSGGAERVDSDKGPREAAKPEKKSGFTLGNGVRVALRVAGYGLLGAGAFYALSGVVGGITNGMDWGPMLGRTALNWQQAVPAIIGGGVMAAGGGLLMKFTKKKEA